MRHENIRRWHDDDEHRRGYDEEEGWRPRGGRRGHVRGPGFAGRPGFPGVPEFPGGPGMRLGMHGFGPWLGDPRGRSRRARRGDTRAAALALLAEEPMNGYQIIQEIGQRSGGVWRPSPGSVYPALQQLEDENLIRADAGEGGRRAYVLTDEGQQYVTAHAEELRAPWDEVAGSAGGTAIEMRRLIGQVAMAAHQVASAGTDAQAAAGRKVLTDARKALYRILAADDDEQAAADGG